MGRLALMGWCMVYNLKSCLATVKPASLGRWQPGLLGCFGPFFRRPGPFAFDLVALNGGQMFLEAARKVMGVFQQPVRKTIVSNSLQI
jgi:hypothetical protein